jgi:hypothetical protein
MLKRYSLKKEPQCTPSRQENYIKRNYGVQIWSTNFSIFGGGSSPKGLNL